MRGRIVTATFAVATILALVASGPVGAVSGWSGPTQIRRDNCTDVAAALDSSGGRHVAVSCEQHIRYLFSKDGKSWATTKFAVPSEQEDLQPQIAIDGSTVYVAWTREDFGTCGFVWAGIYYRSRTLPNGTWSAEHRIGGAEDHLQSFRVVGGVIHLTADGSDKTYYETLSKGHLTRHVLSDPASQHSSLRIGTDGRARIVYEGTSSLRYAVWMGSGFTKTSIPGTTADDHVPSLVLDSRNAAYVLWRHEPSEGCGPPEVTHKAMEFATNRGGTWTPTSQRVVTNVLGEGAIVVESGVAVHVLVGSDTGVRYYRKSLSGSLWVGIKLTARAADSVALRQNPANRSLFAAFDHPDDSDLLSGVYELSKP